MKDFKIGKKLAISYIVIMLLLVIGSGISVLNFVSVGNKVEKFHDGPFAVRGSANYISAGFASMQKSLFRAIANTDAILVQQAILDAETAKEDVLRELPSIGEHYLGDSQNIKDLEIYMAELIPMNEHILNLVSQSRDEEALQYMESDYAETARKVQTELDAIIASADNKGVELIADVRGAQAQSIVTLLIFAALGTGISIAFAVYITQGITKPISELEHAAACIADGELDAVILYESKDELGRLADSMRATILRVSFVINDLTNLLQQLSEGDFNIESGDEEAYAGAFVPLLAAIRQTTSDLSDTMRQISNSAEQVANGSEQVSYGAQALAEGTSEQASTVESLADTISGVSRQVNSNAMDAADANKKADAVGQEADESNHRMQEMLTAMEEINVKSEQIRNIIDTIEEIAFQTNILALNAKVEAARAGAMGKGFAVISDEIQVLSAKSKDATNSTALLFEDSLKAVEHGLAIANETAQSMQSVVDGVRGIVATVGNISAATTEQAQAIGLITQNISQISNVVQSNSATAEESAAASEELSGQAETLKQLVGAFSIRCN